MNTVRQGVYVGVLLAALAGLVALTMTAMVNRPEPYELSSTEVAGLPVLGSSASPACAVADAQDPDCARIDKAKDFDMSRAAGLMQRTTPDPRVQTGRATDRGSSDDQGADEQSNGNSVDTDTDGDVGRQGDADSQGKDPQTSTTAKKPTTKPPTTRPPTTSGRPEPSTTTSNPDDNNRQSAASDSRDDVDDSDDDPSSQDQGDDVAEAKAGKAMQQVAAQAKSNGTTTSTGTSSTPTTSSGSSLDVADFEQSVIALTNKRRKDEGCDPLVPSESLNTASRSHSKDMWAKGYFDHAGQDGSSPGDRAVGNGYSSKFVAENIAWGYRSPEAVVEGWMGSSGHRGNMLDCKYVHIGVGFHDFYWTQTFGVPG